MPGFKGVRHHNLYHGIDLECKGERNTLKSTFFIGAGKSPDQIRMKYKGDDSLNIKDNGSLEISTRECKVIDSPPVVYQVDENNLISLKAGKHTVAVRIGKLPECLYLCRMKAGNRQIVR